MYFLRQHAEEVKNGKKYIEIQPRFKPGFSEFWSDAVTNWATEALALEQ